MQEVFIKITELIKNNKKFIIMTHSNPDLDGMSSALCFYDIITGFKKDVRIYTKKSTANRAVNNMLEMMKSSNYEYIYSDYKEYIDKETILIILDVNRTSLLENSKIIKEVENVLVIDHHILARDCINNTLVSYVNSNLSSIAEFCTEYIKFLNKNITHLLATCLLAAMEIDTNNFNIKTTSKTHNAAASLLELGADNVVAQELLKESKEEYLKRQDMLKNSFIIKDNIAICLFNNNIYTKVDLALASEELITFENIEAAFTIGYIAKDIIGISARSIGNIDVEAIMEKLGGGGHMTEAACEIKGSSKEQAYKNLFEVIK